MFQLYLFLPLYLEFPFRGLGFQSVVSADEKVSAKGLCRCHQFRLFLICKSTILTSVFYSYFSVPSHSVFMFFSPSSLEHERKKCSRPFVNLAASILGVYLLNLSHHFIIEISQFIRIVGVRNNSNTVFSNCDYGAFNSFVSCVLSSF